MTRDRRVAITECVRLVELLVHSTAPGAKALGMIVLTRLAAIGRDGPGKILNSTEAEVWFQLARQNVPPDEEQSSGAGQ